MRSSLFGSKDDHCAFGWAGCIGIGLGCVCDTGRGAGTVRVLLVSGTGFAWTCGAASCFVAPKGIVGGFSMMMTVLRSLINNPIAGCFGEYAAAISVSWFIPFFSRSLIRAVDRSAASVLASFAGTFFLPRPCAGTAWVVLPI